MWPRSRYVGLAISSALNTSRYPPSNEPSMFAAILLSVPCGLGPASVLKEPWYRTRAQKRSAPPPPSEAPILHTWMCWLYSRMAHVLSQHSLCWISFDRSSDVDLQVAISLVGRALRGVDLAAPVERYTAGDGRKRRHPDAQKEGENDGCSQSDHVWWHLRVNLGADRGKVGARARPRGVATRAGMGRSDSPRARNRLRSPCVDPACCALPCGPVSGPMTRTVLDNGPDIARQFWRRLGRHADGALGRPVLYSRAGALVLGIERGER